MVEGPLGTMPDRKAFGQYIKHLRERLDRSQKEVATDIGVHPSYIGHIERGRTKQVSRQMLAAFANALDVTLEELVAAYHLPPRRAGESPSMAFGMIPLAIKGSAPGGAFFSEEERAMGYIAVPPEMVKGARRAYVIVVNGDSMEPGLHCHDMAIIDPERRWEDGDVVLVRMGAEVTVKRVYHTDGLLRLVPDNRKYKDLEIREGRVEILGVVINTIHFGGKP